MPRRFEEIVADFEALTASDFDYANTSADDWDRLDRLCDEMLAVNDADKCAPVMFRTMERLDGVELGTPGPLVHTLEAWPGAYERHLADSVRRTPSRLSVWMINRILNTNPPDSEAWLALLRGVADHPAASPATKAKALDFLKYQTGAKCGA